MARKRSGQITITTAGTAVIGTSVKGSLFQVQANPGNSGVTYVGNDGANDITASNGFPLPAAGPGVVIAVKNLNELYFDAAENGDKVCWILLQE